MEVQGLGRKAREKAQRDLDNTMRKLKQKQDRKVELNANAQFRSIQAKRALEIEEKTRLARESAEGDESDNTGFKQMFRDLKEFEKKMKRHYKRAKKAK